MRVKVMDGTGEHLIGYGLNVGEIVRRHYLLKGGKGYLLLSGDKDLPRPDRWPAGYDFVEEKMSATPKIVMDSGETMYGDQCWWEPVEEVEE